MMRALLALVLGLLHGQSAQAQSFVLDEPILPSFSAQMINTFFYVYSREEAPRRNDDSPMPSVTFTENAISTAAGAPLKDPSSIHVTFVRYRDADRFIGHFHRCGENGGLETSDIEGYDYTLGKKQADPITIRFTGTYVIMVTNCGKEDAKVTMQAVVKNSYGYLSGADIPRLSFYGSLTGVYFILALVWGGLLYRWQNQLILFHHRIAYVIAIGLVEAMAWWAILKYANATGEQHGILANVNNVFVSLLASVKRMATFTLLLSAALGWGITRPFLDESVLMKMWNVGTLYVTLDLLAETVTKDMMNYSIYPWVIILSQVCSWAFKAYMASWLFTSLTQLMETLEARQQTAKLHLFQTLYKVLLVTFVVVMMTGVLFLICLTPGARQRWKTVWMLNDGASHVVFLGLLVAMMFLLAPREHSKEYGYSSADNEKATDEIWEKEEADEEEEEEEETSFWATTKDKEQRRGGDVGDKI